MNVITNLEIHKINLRGTVLKPNMILPGSNCKNRSSSEEIAKKTLECLKKNVPSEVPRYCIFIWWPIRN